MSEASATQLTKEDLERRLDAQARRIEHLEEQNKQLIDQLGDFASSLSEQQSRIAELEADTDLLRLVEHADEVSAENGRKAILQHMWRAIRNEPGEDRVYAMDPEKVTEILHHPDVDRTTILRWMRTTPRLIGNDDVCWYDGGDTGPGGKPARIHLDIRDAGESVLENVRRQVRSPNGGS